MSLGASRSTWVAALDEKIKAVAPISQMTRYRDFADSGHYRLHGIYYFVPGVLACGIDMEHIVALTAPRYQLILSGDSDTLSPIAGIHKIVDHARNVYAEQGAADQFRGQALRRRRARLFAGDGRSHARGLHQTPLVLDDK